MENRAYIYKKQLIATGKFYIGKHNGKNKNYKGSGDDWLVDYKLHVKDPDKDVITEIIEWVDNIENINKREVYWLEFYDAANNPLFYNKTNKAKGPDKIDEEVVKRRNKKITGQKRSEETKSLMSEIRTGKPLLKLRGKPSKRKGTKMSEESKRKIGEAAKKRFDEGKQISPMLDPEIARLAGLKKKGKKQSQKHIQQRVNKNKGQKRTQESCDKISRSRKGWIPSKQRNKKLSESLKKPVCQYDLEGNFIKEWPSQGEAQKCFGGDVYYACQNFSRTSSGFRWKYK